MSDNINDDIGTFVHLIKGSFQAIQHQIQALDRKGEELSKILQDIRLRMASESYNTERLQLVEKKTELLEASKANAQSIEVLETEVRALKSFCDKAEGAQSNKEWMWKVLIALPGLIALIASLLSGYGFI